MSAKQAIQLAGIALIFAFVSYPIADGLKTGKILLRGGIVVRKVKSPFSFWFSIALGNCSLFLMVWLAVSILEGQP